MAHLRNTEARQAGGGKDARPSKSAVSGSALPGAGGGGGFSSANVLLSGDQGTLTPPTSEHK